MKIKRITGTSVAIPYASPVGPYVGRGGGSGTLGAAGLIVKIETDVDVVGWGEGTGKFETDPNTLLAGKDVANIEGAIAALEAGGISKGPMSGIEMALWDAMGKGADLPVCKLLGGRGARGSGLLRLHGTQSSIGVRGNRPRVHGAVGVSFLKDKSG